MTRITEDGLWLSLDAEKIFLAFDDFPWFRDAPSEAIYRVEQPRPGHLRWPALDVDLSVGSIREPARYPRVAHTRLG